jgi:hypothetical protein
MARKSSSDSSNEAKEIPQYTVPSPSGNVTEQQVRDIVSEMMNNMTGVQRVQSGQIQSANFVSGSAGWQILANGNVEFNNGTFRGDLLIGSATSSAVAIDASAGTISLDYNNAVAGTISGLHTAHGTEIQYLKLLASSGRYIALEDSKIYINGDLDISGSYKQSNHIGVGYLSESNVNTFSIEIRGGIITNFNKNS